MLTVGDHFPRFSLTTVLPGPPAELGEIDLEDSTVRWQAGVLTACGWRPGDPTLTAA